MLQADNQGAPERVAHTSGPGRTCAEPILAAAPLTSPSQHQLTLSIIIKALNEERHIASAIESALGSLGEIDAEVILADGGSTDRTIEIARQYPIVIVQLTQTKDRSCGSGAQLGFQYSRGRYLLLMDGDMQLDPGFLPAAIEMLTRNPRLAGVGGTISEPDLVNEEYEQRRKRFNQDNRVGRVTRLDSSGLYRRAAIESIGYLTDRNLHASEEFDLGARLHCAGWTLIKTDRPIVYHETHRGNVYRLLLRRVLTMYACAPGEVLRAAMAKRYFWFGLRNNRQWLICVVVTAWWGTLLSTLALPGFLRLLTAGVIVLLPFAGMSLRWRSFRLGLYSVATANAIALCFWPGLLRPRIAPTSWIESTALRSPQLDGGQKRQSPAFGSPDAPAAAEFSFRSSRDARGVERLNT
jgi:glycosyltransferase involved in cell wall biosynthesis